MTNAHLLSHPFPLSHPFSSSATWKLLDEDGDESAPSLTAPLPSNHLPSADFKTGFDPALCVTPERTVPLRVPIRTVPSKPEDEQQPNLRTTKVHFDQTVSVHHISPECGRSPDNLSELNEDVLSSMCNELDTSDVEPISIIASDLRRLSPTSVSLLGELESTRSTLQSSSTGRNISGGIMRKKKSKSRSSPSTQVATESVNAGGNLADSADNSEDAGLSECVLARPELNSTLSVSNKIAQLQLQEFDMVAVTKEKISPKLKQQVFEKVILMIII